jgi:UDP-N-acetylmuramoyl-tripeptide--D-alanyl-D-alanine ligase
MEHKFRINVPGEHHIYNALSAILLGVMYNIPIEEIEEGIKKFKPSGMRQDITRLKDMVIIKDCYNASPTSMKSGLEVLTVTKPKDGSAESRKVAVLGDMLELGDFARDAHFDVGTLCSEYMVDCLVAIGPNAKYVAEGAIAGGFSSSELYVFHDNTSAIEHISEIIRPNDVILFKGSRGMRLEEVADYIAENDVK